MCNLLEEDDERLPPNSTANFYPHHPTAANAPRPPPRFGYRGDQSDGRTENPTSPPFGPRSPHPGAGPAAVLRRPLVTPVPGRRDAADRLARRAAHRRPLPVAGGRRGEGDPRPPARHTDPEPPGDPARAPRRRHWHEADHGRGAPITQAGLRPGGVGGRGDQRARGQVVRPPRLRRMAAPDDRVLLPHRRLRTPRR